MFRDRAAQFGERAGWEVPRSGPDGVRTRQYDALTRFTSCGVGARDGRHGGSMRLFCPPPAARWVAEHFAHLLCRRRLPARFPAIWDSTRFCLAPEARPRGCSRADAWAGEEDPCRLRADALPGRVRRPHGTGIYRRDRRGAQRVLALYGSGARGGWPWGDFWALTPAARARVALRQSLSPELCAALPSSARPVLLPARRRFPRASLRGPPSRTGRHRWGAYSRPLNAELTLSGDQSETWTPLAGLLARQGVDLETATVLPRAGGHESVAAALGKAGSGKTLLLARLTEALTDAAFDLREPGLRDRRRKDGATLAPTSPTNRRRSCCRQRGVPATTINRHPFTRPSTIRIERIARMGSPARCGAPRGRPFHPKHSTVARAFFDTHGSIPG